MCETIKEYIKKCEACQQRKNREFQKGEWVYLYNPTRRPGLSRKFAKSWSGPFQITAKISDLNYEILGHNNRKWVVHINRLKAAHGYEARDSNPRKPRASRQRKDTASSHDSDELPDVQLGTRPLLKEVPQGQDTVHNPPLCSPDQSPPTNHTLDTPMSERHDPSYLPESTPRSRREIQSTRDEPPLTRARTRLNAQEQMFNVDIHIFGDKWTVVARQLSSKLTMTLLCSLLPRIVRSKLATDFVEIICVRKCTQFEYDDVHTVENSKSTFHFTQSDRLAY